MIEAKNSQTEGHLKGKTIILTGANSGIGKETTRELYRHGARVIMACRNEDETQKVIDNFKSLYPQSNGELLFRRLDLTSFASVKEFVNQITREEKQVHMLINNAAVFAAPIEATSDGFELNVQVNHLSPALLTFLLLPKLQESNSSQSVSNKVIMVSSSLYKYGKIDEELLKKVDSAKITQLCNENRPDKEVYSSTKLVNLLFTRKLSENHSLLKNVEVCLLCPGFTYTRLHRYSPTNAQINGHEYEWKKQLVSVRENVRLEDELSKVTSTRKIEHVTKVCIVTVGEHPYY
ncbi:PREDICTED: retinol dehydrogenase 14-like [Rhagoletis zephyria]|uniref:retinol dehydrogenase 14-like n=1 Tax=Rhagoletis zephyria TaxID=28612 RepID=UPI0008115BE1|nr:PREDICTED: retinol dehydrogenase 14-like [Rhagoletis zephyria]